MLTSTTTPTTATTSLNIRTSGRQREARAPLRLTPGRLRRSQAHPCRHRVLHRCIEQCLRTPKRQRTQNPSPRRRASERLAQGPQTTNISSPTIAINRTPKTLDHSNSNYPLGIHDRHAPGPSHNREKASDARAYPEGRARTSGASTGITL